MDEILMIVSAGKSSRFGGYPKAFCSLGDSINIENTVYLAKLFFKDIYVIVNEETYTSGIVPTIQAQVVPIVTGQGDAHSILKALRKLIVLEPRAERVFACWGDAVFVDDTPFREIINATAKWDADSPALIGCSMDRTPYAWFDTEGKWIKKSHFQKEDGICSCGLHDQSLFVFRTAQMMSYLTRYKSYLGFDSYDENSYKSSRGEMKLLNSLTFFYEQGDMVPAEYCEITERKVLSFNTADELERIKSLLKTR